VDKVPKTATRLAAYILINFDPSLRNWRTKCAQTDLALTLSQ